MQPDVCGSKSTKIFREPKGSTLSNKLPISREFQKEIDHTQGTTENK